MSTLVREFHNGVNEKLVFKYLVFFAEQVFTAKILEWIYS